MNDGTRYYSISEVCRKLKVAESTLRYYEKEFADFLIVKRSSGNRRLYTDENIGQLKVLIRLLKREKLSIAAARDRLREEESDSRPEVKGAVPPKPTAPPRSGEVETVTAAMPIGAVTQEDVEVLHNKLNQCMMMQQQLIESVKKIGTISREMKHLLDLNLQRYNLLSQQINRK